MRTLVEVIRDKFKKPADAPKAPKPAAAKPHRGVFIRCTLNGVLLGIDDKPCGTPCINIQDIDLKRAAWELAGGEIDFRSAPKAWHDELETRSGVLTVQMGDIRQFFERI